MIEMSSFGLTSGSCEFSSVSTTVSVADLSVEHISHNQ